MKVYYLDSSAWVKRYFEEQGSDWVDGLFEGDHLLSCSTLGLIEVRATTARKRDFSRIDALAYAEANYWLLEDWGAFSRCL